MTVNVVNFRLKDSEADSRPASFPYYLPSGDTLANYLANAQAFATKLDAVTGSQITEMSLLVQLALPEGLKSSPVASSLNERGGIILFDTTGQYSDSVRIPAIKTTIMPGDEFSLLDTDVAALIAQLKLTVNGLLPKTRDGFDWVSGTSGKKSFRRK